QRRRELGGEQVRPRVDLVDRLGLDVLDRARLDDREQTLGVTARPGTDRDATAGRGGLHDAADLLRHGDPAATGAGGGVATTGGAGRGGAAALGVVGGDAGVAGGGLSGGRVVSAGGGGRPGGGRARGLLGARLLRPLEGVLGGLSHGTLPSQRRTDAAI